MNKPFARFRGKAGTGDAALREAVGRASRGMVDANLGGGVIKQRIARAGGGRSGGFRTIILFRKESRAFFVHGFAKSERDNIRDDELAAFKSLAAVMLEYCDLELAVAVSNGALQEIEDAA